MPTNYYVTHTDLAKSLDKATVHGDDDDDCEQLTAPTPNASSTDVGKDDEQNGEVEFINGGTSMEVELSTNNDIPPTTTFKSLDNCEEKNVHPSPTSAIDDLSPFTNEKKKPASSQPKVDRIVQAHRITVSNTPPPITHSSTPSTTPISKLNLGKTPLLQSSPVSAFISVPEQSTRTTLNDKDVPNSRLSINNKETSGDVTLLHLQTTVTNTTTTTVALELDKYPSTDKEEVQVSEDYSHLKSDLQQPSDMNALDASHDDMVVVAPTPTNEAGVDTTAAALQLDTTPSPLVVQDIWEQKHQVGPFLSSIFTTLQQEHKSTSFRVIWNGMKEKYIKIDYVEYAKPIDPFLIEQKRLYDALSKFIHLIAITHKQMRKEGKGPLSDAEEELWGLLSILGLLHLQEIHPIIAKDCNDDVRFRLRKLTDLVGELRGQYRLLKDLDDIVNGRWKIGISNRKVEGMFRRIWEQLYPPSADGSVEHEVEDDEEEEEVATGKCIFWELFLLASTLQPQYHFSPFILSATSIFHTITQKKDKIDKAKMVGMAGFFYNLAESLKMNDESPLLKEIIELAALITPSFQGHNDNKDDAKAEGTNYFMEASLSSMFSCIPGLVLEKLLNLGSNKVRRICQSPPQDISDHNEDATNEFKSCVKFILLFTWPTEKEALYAYIEQRLDPEKDKDTLLALKAMILPQHPSKFLKLYETQTLFDNSDLLEQYVDSYGSEGFDAVKQAAEIIITAIKSNDKDTIYTAIASLDKKSPLGARYLHPTDKAAYSAAVDKQLKEAKDAACYNEIIVIEETSIEQLDKKAKAEHLPTNSEKFTLLNNDKSVAGTIYKYNYNGKTIKILVTPSWHCIRGSHYTIKQRINNGQSYITIMRILKNAKISSSTALLKQLQIFYAQLIEMEGWFGDLAVDTKKCKGSVWKAIRNALPKDLCFDPIRGGVAALGKSISPVNGIDSLKVVCLAAVLGIDDFTTMKKIGYDIEFPCTDFSTSLLALGCNFHKDRSVRISVAKELEDNEINRECAKKSVVFLMDGWH